MRPLVTIDDPITLIEPHRVLLEWVDQVHRDYFIVRSHGSLYKHDQEGITWARGHHLPDSEVVIALRAAASLVVHKELTPPVLPQLPTPSFDLQKMVEEAKKAMEEAEAAAKGSGRSWWRSIVFK